MIDHVLVLERESYEVFINHLSEEYQLENAVQIHLKDYHSPMTVDLVKIQSKQGSKIVVVSETLTYQSHVPYQTLMLPMRVSILISSLFKVVILGCKPSKFIVSPHIWNIPSKIKT